MPLPMPPSFEPRRLIEGLCEHSVAFVVIGGFACEVHGVAHSPVDVDIIIQDSEVNAAALLAALKAMNAVHARLPGSGKSFARP